MGTKYHFFRQKETWAQRDASNIITCKDDSDSESIESLDGCDSDEEVVHADDISTLLAQVRATASE